MIPKHVDKIDAVCYIFGQNIFNIFNARESE